MAWTFKIHSVWPENVLTDKFWLITQDTDIAVGPRRLPRSTQAREHFMKNISKTTAGHHNTNLNLKPDENEKQNENITRRVFCLT